MLEVERCEVTDNKRFFSLHDRVVVITGGAGLLGRRFAQVVLDAGGCPVVADIDRQKVGDSEQSLAGKYPGRMLGVEVDVANQQSVHKMVEAVMDKFGRLDALVNNAAIDPKFDRESAGKNVYKFENYPLELWQKSVDVNLTGAFICAQEIGRLMIESGSGGVMVNVSSTYGIVAPDQKLYRRDGEEEQALFKPVSYPVTKAALIQLTKFLATYWAGKNIRVNTLSPHGVYNNQDEQFVARFAERSPMGRMAKDDEIASALLFLLSDASSYMNGANLVVDGGWTAW
ncbi:SDR family oxidoreductase [Gemmatimonadota bacterium]